ncbi:MAG: hypothetical protein H6985_06710 [Pseudomonadales bacterium]|nr:hypothetical protein [Halioglobus sp.]MCP5129255.1 hypothetical protein [Pseudomonadales bacterium]
MKLSDAKVKFEDGYFGFVEIRKNPGNVSEYIALLYGVDGKSFMLCYENDTVISAQELEHLVLMLKEVGFRRAKIYF